MSADDNLIDGLMAMRLRDTLNGFHKGIEMTQPLISIINNQITTLINDPEIDQSTVRKITRLLLPSLCMLYEQFFPSEIEYAKKFLGQLQVLQFDTSTEMQKIKEFESFIDELIPPIERLDISLQSNSWTTTEMLDQVTNNMKKASQAAQQLNEIQLAIDKRVTDVLHSISMFIDPERAKILYEAFTREP